MNLVLRIGLASLLVTVGRAQEPAATNESCRVTATFNHAPFSYQSRLLNDRASFRVYRLTYPSPVVTPIEQNNTVPADYYLPKNLRAGAKYPAVICLHILNGDEQLTDLVCSVLAGRGIPALSFKLPYYGERASPQGRAVMAEKPKLFMEAITQTGEDIRRTVDLLASRDEINAERIGITGISLGGITGAAAAGGEPRIYRASLVLSGGDLMAIIRHARETRDLRELLDRLPPPDRAEVEAKIAAADPLRFAPALRERARAGRVLMINAGEDEVIPRQCTEKLAQALGIAERVVWFEGLGHYTAMAEMPRALRMTADFFAQDLPAEVRAVATPLSGTTATQRLVGIVAQVVGMISVEPGPDRCHFIDLALSAKQADGRSIESQTRFVRGANGRFSLHCRLPLLGEVALGQGDYPWLLTNGTTVLAGTKNPVAGTNWFGLVDPQLLLRLRMAAGLGGGIVLAPEVLQQWLTVEEDKTSTATHAIRMMAKDQRKLPGEVRIVFGDDGRTPAAATFSAKDIEGRLEIRGWQTNTVAPKILFDPPPALPRTEVDQADLHRTMAAMLNSIGGRLNKGRGKEKASGAPTSVSPAEAPTANELPTRDGE